MNIVVNGFTHNVRASNYLQVLEELGYTHATVATALNGTFLSAGERESTTLVDGDVLEILAPMQGG